MASEATLSKQVDEPAAPELTRGNYYRPNVDILEKPEELLVVADMPGVDGKQIDVRFEDGELTIHGTAPRRQEQDTTYLLREYGVGDFYRTFRVSQQVDSTRISAEYANGVLTLHLPKVEAAKPRRIAVQAH